MSAKTKSTVKMLCIRSGIMSQEIPDEAQKLLELYNDPDVSSEQKMIAAAELDAKIKELEDRVTTRKLSGEESSGTLRRKHA